MSKKALSELRRDMSAVLSRLDARWLQAASHEVCGRLSKLADGGAGRVVRHVLAFAPHYSGEADLSGFIEDQFGKRTVYLPRLLPDQGMTFVAIGENWLDQVEYGALGIPEPRPSGALYDKSFAAESLIILPGLAFDRRGARVGRDRQAYARFLHGAMSAALKVGACWSLQLLENIAAATEEPSMDWICHERELVRTGERFEDE